MNRNDLAHRFSQILDDRWPLSGKLMAAVDEYVISCRTADRQTLTALRDNLREPARGVLQAVIDLVEQPGPSNGLAWAFEAFGATEQQRGVEAVRRPPRSPAEGADDFDVHVADVRRDVVTQWIGLQGGRVFAEVLHKVNRHQAGWQECGLCNAESTAIVGHLLGDREEVVPDPA